jgi:hypothetical protein
MNRNKKNKDLKKINANLPQEEALNLYTEISHLRKQIEELQKAFHNYTDRLEDAEIHINLLTRLLTTLCIEKLGMRVGVLKRLLKRIEKEAIRDSQILHLESLYNLPHESEAKETKETKPPHPPNHPKRDPWDEIS